jgi:lysyl oxidase
MHRSPRFTKALAILSAFASTLFAQAVFAADPGALISMSMNSTVGILLDEIPAGVLRDAAAANALAQGSDFWAARAARQTNLAYYRLVYRGEFYPNYKNNQKGPLPLPDKSKWSVNVTGPALRYTTADGHDVVAAPYTFSTYIVSDAASPAIVEANFKKIGGTWDEPLLFPIDPELILQRTGFACMDEIEYPPNSVFEENTVYFYDQTCVVEQPGKPTNFCHFWHFPTESCQQALSTHVGMVSTSMHFQRVAYDPVTAAQYRVGQVLNPNGSDLSVVQDAMQDEHRFFYRFFAPDSCEVVEGSVAGWRRLLTFSAVVQNNGTAPVHIGDPTDAKNPYRQANDYVYSSCHNHYHFSYYGSFTYGGGAGAKQAFCLEDTNRFHNDETTPLTAVHQTCEMQGIGAGWGDEYQFGIPGQWVDVTNIDTTKAKPLTFVSNPYQALCEGQTLDANNNPVDPTNLSALGFHPTSFLSPDGSVVSFVNCSFYSGWDAQNTGSVPVSSPGGSFVTDSCDRGQIGPKRDCGFAASGKVQSCAAGSPVNLKCKAGGSATQIVRACEVSQALGTGTSCSLLESAANAVVDSSGATVSFACPAVRDATAGNSTGGYQLYSAPVLPWQSGSSVICSAQ